jgi:hypothetical protein
MMTINVHNCRECIQCIVAVTRARHLTLRQMARFPHLFSLFEKEKIWKSVAA